MNTRRRNSGHVAVEWVLATFVMIMVLFVPVPGAEQSVVGVFMDSARDFYGNTSLIYSLP